MVASIGLGDISSTSSSITTHSELPVSGSTLSWNIRPVDSGLIALLEGWLTLESVRTRVRMLKTANLFNPF